MDGDLSLSQSFGGLRIANPDDFTLSFNSTDAAIHADETASSESTLAPTQPQLQPAAAPAQSSLSNEGNSNLSSFNHDAPPQELAAAGDRAPALPSLWPETSSQRSTNRMSMPYTYEGQHLQRQPSPQFPAVKSQPAYNPQTNATRPASSYYPPNVANGVSPNPISRDPNYRLRTESSSSSVTDMKRSNSRSSAMALQAGVPTRDNSHSDRSYKQTRFQTGNGNGPLPPRSTSRPLGTSQGSGISHLSNSPYGLESGPLSSSEEWQERGAAVGIRQEIDATTGKPVARYVKKGVRDFVFGATLGEGSYSTVMLATDRQTLKEYAIKILDKRHIIKEKKVKYVNIEKDTLNRLTEHPGVVRLYYTFQDERSLYFVLDYCKAGELLGVLKRMVTFDEECTRFYGAQILDTIDYMHKRGVIHRDLKPENVLLDDQMHVKITDFGTAKILSLNKQQDSNSNGIPAIDSTETEDRAGSFVGTAEYVSPELLTDKSACKASDLWAFGCIIYQLLAGRPPFKAGNEYQTFQKIVSLDYEFPMGFPPIARDLVERLLVLDPARRLPIEHIKNHEFFQGIEWGRRLWKQKAPRLKSYVPPPPEPIKLNGTSDGESYPPSIVNHGSNIPSSASTRAFPRVITELAPPSQLDIEWSPVLTRNNERILKLGNWTVLSSPAAHSPNSRGGESDAPKKFSRFFGGSTTKKRQRLVLVTSAARVILCPAGGDDKRAKVEISLLASGTSYRTATDSKGLSSWVIDTRDKHFVFEDPKPSSSEAGTSALLTQEWLDTLDRAKEMAISQGSAVEESYRDIPSAMSSHANTLERSSEFGGEHPNGGRSHLVKNPPNDTDSVKGRKRFSRRHSKNGLAAVF